MEHVFLAVQDMISESIDEIKWTDYDMGQLEHYHLRPSVLFPCALIDIEVPEASDQRFPMQLFKTRVTVRIGFEVPGQTHSKTPTEVKEKAMGVFAILNKTHALLHGFEGEGFNKLLFRGVTVERREDPLKVFIMHFDTSYTVTKPDLRVPVLAESVITGTLHFPALPTI